MEDIGVGEVLKNLRLESGFRSQRKLGEKSGISPATISRIEKNIQHPNPATLLRLSPYFTGVTYQDLLKLCGYVDFNVSLVDLEIIEKLKEIPDFYEEIKNEPSMIPQLYKIWKMVKDINKERSI